MFVEGLGELPVFPCRADKRPLTRRGFYDAQRIEPPWSWPLVGVPTGAVSGFDVLDIDPEGEGWLRENEHRLPETRRHKTERSCHILFTHAAGLRNSTSRIAKGVDVRGDGGYVIWWPREGLVVGEAPLVEWPGWLLELAIGGAAVKGCTQAVAPMMGEGHAGGEGAAGIRPTASLKLRSKYVLLKVERARVGERNNTLFWGACRFGEMIGEGRIKREIAEHLLEEACKISGLWGDPGDGPEVCWVTIRSGIETGIRRWALFDVDVDGDGGQHLVVQPLTAAPTFTARAAPRAALTARAGVAKKRYVLSPSAMREWHGYGAKGRYQLAKEYEHAA
jgi:Bifunctional DNA primase/polymerase, N-terminal